MDKNDINKLIILRTKLINDFDRLRDYKNNKNAIMKEVEHASLIHETIVALDSILGEHVEFSDKK